MIDKIFVADLIKSKFNITPTNIHIINNIGTMNSVYLLEFGSRKLIIRLRENDVYAENEFMKEAWFSQQCAKLEIPAPRIMYIGKYDNVDYMIEEFIDGITGDKYPDRSFVFQQLGIYSKKIKSIPVSGYGVTISNFDTNTFADELYTSPSEQIEKNIAALITSDVLIDLNVYDSRYITSIKNSFLSLLSKDLKCALNHGDISLSNTIVTSNGTVYWIDFGSVNANILYNEFANLKVKSDYDIDCFAKGFGISAQELKGDLASYALLSSFDKLRWALTTKNQEYINWYTQNAKQCFKSYINTTFSQER